jgi:hypothetical protein
MGADVSVLKCLKELGYGLKWGIGSNCLEMCKELSYRLNWVFESSCFEFFKETGIQILLGE